MAIREIVAAILALIVIAVFSLLVLFDAVNGKPISVPDSLLVLVSLVTGVYFGQHATATGAENARQTAATTAAAVVNGTNAATTKPTP